MECGLKALLIVCGVKPDPDGSIPDPKTFRTHMPALSDRITLSGHLIPDGPRAQHYLAMVPLRGNFSDWAVDHRYWRDGALPLASIPQWEAAVLEIKRMLDQATQDGVI